MQSASSKPVQQQLKIVLLFVAILSLAYLPLTSFLFYLKNDAFLNYFPPKFFMSESIHAGYLPLWNPYINYGIPQYADMNAGYWSPITWLIASTVGYNAYTFTLELFSYLLIAGLGTYQLCGIWISSKPLKIIAGVAFMCCGFNVGHLQHFNWISGAAFLPWCFWSYHLLSEHLSVKHTIFSTVCFYMFISSAHPGLVIGAFYFFFALFIFAFIRVHKNRQLQKKISKIFFVHGLFIGALILLGAGLISGYTDVLPHFIRGEKLTLGQALAQPTSLVSWISALLPFITVKNDALFATDISMRNCHFSLTLFLFFVVACFQRKTAWQKFLFITGVLFALLSAGGIFKTIGYNILPMIGYVRLNGEFRIFSLLCFILLSVIELQKFTDRKGVSLSTLGWLAAVIGAVLTCTIVYGFTKIIQTSDSFLFRINLITGEGGFSASMKMLIDQLSFFDTLWIQGIIQLVTIYFIWRALRSRKLYMLLTVTVINLIIVTLLQVPFTGAGQASVKAIQSVFNKSPKGIPVPTLKPIVQNDSLSTAEKSLIGDWNFYNKQIGNLFEYPYPIVLKSMRQRYKDIHTSRFLAQKPFLFLPDPARRSPINITHFNPNELKIQVRVDSAQTLVIQQNHYPHWYYRNGHESADVQMYNNGLMGLPLKEGMNNITISFRPKLVKWMMLVSLMSILTGLSYLLYSRFK